MDKFKYVFLNRKPSETLKSNNFSNLLYFSIFGATVLFGIVMVVMQLNRPLVFDEIEWSLVSKGVLTHGFPVSFYGEDAFVRRYPNELIGYPAHYGLWHPPLYLYVLGLFSGIVGDSVATARLVGACSGVLTLIMVGIIAKEIAQARSISVKCSVFLSVVLCLINPYFIQGILYLDVDNTILMPLVLLFFYGLTKWGFSESFFSRELLLIGTLFTLTLWAKLTTPILILSGIGLASIVTRRWRALINFVVVGVIGLAIFIVSWLVYTYLLDLPPDFFLRFTFLQKTSYYSKVGTLVNQVTSFARLFLWMMPALSCLIFLSVIDAITSASDGKQKELKIEWILAVAIIAVFVGYTLWVPTISMKYRVLMVPFAAPLMSILIIDRLCKAGQLRIMPMILWVVFSVGYFVFIVPDLMLVPTTVGRNMSENLLQKTMADPRLSTWGLSVLPLLIGPIFFSLKWSGIKYWFNRVLVSLLLTGLVAGVVQNVRCASANYSPLSFQPQAGFNETISALNKQCGDGIVFAPKDIGFYLYPHCKVIPMDESEIFEFRDEADMLAVITNRTDVQWAVDSAKYPNLRLFPKVQTYLEYNFDRSNTIGDFIIYKRKSLH